MTSFMYGNLKWMNKKPAKLYSKQNTLKRVDIFTEDLDGRI